MIISSFSYSLFNKVYPVIFGPISLHVKQSNCYINVFKYIDVTFHYDLNNINFNDMRNINCDQIFRKHITLHKLER